jgi:hypothetical protein
MNEYTYCSIDPDHYNIIQCPIQYNGASEQVTWTVSGLMSYCHLVVLDKDDYIEFKVWGSDEEGNDVTLTYKLTVKQIHKTIDATVISIAITEGVKTLTNETIQFIKTEEGYSQFIGIDTIFEVTSMSYRMRLALGFYYPIIWPILSTLSFETGRDEVTSKAIGYNLSTPMWYVLSNLGSPNNVSHEFNPYT